MILNMNMVILSQVHYRLTLATFPLKIALCWVTIKIGSYVAVALLWFKDPAQLFLREYPYKRLDLIDPGGHCYFIWVKSKIKHYILNGPNTRTSNDNIKEHKKLSAGQFQATGIVLLPTGTHELLRLSKVLLQYLKFVDH